MISSKDCVKSPPKRDTLESRRRRRPLCPSQKLTNSSHRSFFYGVPQPRANVYEPSKPMAFSMAALGLSARASVHAPKGVHAHGQCPRRTTVSFSHLHRAWVALRMACLSPLASFQPSQEHRGAAPQGGGGPSRASGFSGSVARIECRLSSTSY